MNQILVTEKLYVTPELRRKKKIYKINFILSILVIIGLVIFYFYMEYDKTKSEGLSQEILSNLTVQTEEISELTEEEERANEEVWKIIVASVENKETNEEVKQETESGTGTSTETKEKEKSKKYGVYTAPNGKVYQTIGSIKIPKINVNYPVLNETTTQLLRVSPCKFYGPDNLNEVGNMCIAGHNWRNKQFFSNVPKLVVGDIIELTDLKGNTLKYSVYDKYTVVPKDTSCTEQNTNGKKIVTLITCTDDSKKRVIVQAKEIV